METYPVNAIDIDWEHDILEFLECLTEYAYGAVIGKEDRVISTSFLGLLLTVTVFPGVMLLLFQM